MIYIKKTIEQIKRKTFDSKRLRIYTNLKYAYPLLHCIGHTQITGKKSIIYMKRNNRVYKIKNIG